MLHKVAFDADLCMLEVSRKYLGDDHCELLNPGGTATTVHVKFCSLMGLGNDVESSISTTSRTSKEAYSATQDLQQSQLHELGDYVRRYGHCTYR